MPTLGRLQQFAAGALTKDVMGFNWGMFTMTIVQVNPGSKRRWAWQCACPFHKKNRTTGCKRRLGVPVDTTKPEFPDSCRETLFTLFHWANQAKKHNRQRTHLGSPLVYGDHPEPLLIKAQQIKDGPATIVLDDDDLDSRERDSERASARAAASSR